MFKTLFLASACLTMVAVPANAQRGAPINQGVTSSDLAAQVAQARQQNAQLQIEVGILTDDLRVMRGRVETSEYELKQARDEIEEMQDDDRDLAQQINDLRQEIADQKSEIRQLRAQLSGDAGDIGDFDEVDGDGEASTRSLSGLSSSSSSGVRTTASSNDDSATSAGVTRRTTTVTRSGPTQIVTNRSSNPVRAVPDSEAARERSETTSSGLGTISASSLPGRAGPLFADAKSKLIRFDYAGAEEAFRAFIDAFGDDPQAGEAHYWLGEALYQQKAYADSGAAYTTMIRSYPDDPRAPDALVKLARSMRLIGDKEKACLALDTLPKRYPKASNVTMELSAVERTRSGCGA